MEKKDKKESWDSNIKILKKIEVILPLKLLLVCNQISDKVRGDEFSIVVNIKEKDNETIELSEEYYIPKQIVTSTSIEYLKDEYKNNCVIHRHPDGMNNFSSTDKTFINQNFELSILYTKQDGFVAGIYNLKHDDYVIQIPVECFVNYGIEDIDVSNIEKPAPLMIIDKNRKTKSKYKDKEIELVAKHEWDLDRTDTIPERKVKLFPEETLDYTMMKEFMLEEVTGEIQDLHYRLETLEESIYHNTGFNCEGPMF